MAAKCSKVLNRIFEDAVCDARMLIGDLMIGQFDKCISWAHHQIIKLIPSAWFKNNFSKKIFTRRLSFL